MNVSIDHQFFSFLLGTFSVLDYFIRVYQHMVHGELHAYALSVTVLDHYARITLDFTRGKSTQTKLFTTTFCLYETNLFLYKRHYRLLLQIFWKSRKSAFLSNSIWISGFRNMIDYKINNESLPFDDGDNYYQMESYQ